MFKISELYNLFFLKYTYLNYIYSYWIALYNICFIGFLLHISAAVLSLADELGTALSLQLGTNSAHNHRSFLMLKCHSYLRDEDSSPDSDRFQSTDVDSGNSTAHSPELKSISPQVVHHIEHQAYSYTTIGIFFNAHTV